MLLIINKYSILPFQHLVLHPIASPPFLLSKREEAVLHHITKLFVLPNQLKYFNQHILISLLLIIHVKLAGLMFVLLPYNEVGSGRSIQIHHASFYSGSTTT